MMGVMTLITGKLFLRSHRFTPEAVTPSVNANLPVTVGHPVAFPAEEDRFVFGNHTTIMIGKGIRVLCMMAIEAPEVQTMGKKHILMCTEGKM